MSERDAPGQARSRAGGALGLGLGGAAASVAASAGVFAVAAGLSGDTAQGLYTLNVSLLVLGALVLLLRSPGWRAFGVGLLAGWAAQLAFVAWFISALGDALGD